MAVGEAHLFPTFLTCFCRGERWKYAGKKVPLNRGSNSQPGHESNTLTIEPPGWGIYIKELKTYFNGDFGIFMRKYESII